MATLNALLNGRNYGTFKNANGEYCRIRIYDLGNNPKIQVIFAKGVFDIATRNAINTTSENKILKLIKEEGFNLQNSL